MPKSNFTPKTATIISCVTQVPRRVRDGGDLWQNGTCINHDKDYWSLGRNDHEVARQNIRNFVKSTGVAPYSEKL